VQVLGNYVISAEGQHGVAVYEYSGSQGFVCKDRHEFDGASARQVVLMRGKRMAAVQVAGALVALVHITEEGRLRFLGCDASSGPNYYRQLSRNALNEQYVGITPLGDGLTWFDSRAEPAARLRWKAGTQF